MQSRKIAIVPARGGSRRLPRKNVLPFREQPMISWTVEAARECDLFDRIIVTTEDDEIAEAAKGADAEILPRPVQLAGDDVPLADVLLHALHAIDVSADTDVCMLMPNCPLRDGRDILDTYAVHSERQSDVCMSVVSYDWRPPQWALQMNDHGWYTQVHGKEVGKAVTKSERWVAPSGAVRWVRAGKFSAEAAFYPDRLSGHELPWHRAIDIDEAEDFEMAECVAHAIDNGFIFSEQP